MAFKIGKGLRKLDKQRHNQETEIERVIHQLENDPITKDGIRAMELLEVLEEHELKLEEKELMEPPRSFGDMLADKIASFGGSWTFITMFFIFLAVWMGLNAMALVNSWDPYPFILLNLVLSCLAAIQAPIIMMSQNRQAVHDRERDDIEFHRTKLDLQVDTLSAKSIRNADIARAELMKKINRLDRKLSKLLAENKGTGSKKDAR